MVVPLTGGCVRLTLPTLTTFGMSTLVVLTTTTMPTTLMGFVSISYNMARQSSVTKTYIMVRTKVS